MYYIHRIKTHISHWIQYLKEHLVRFITITILFILLCFSFTFFYRQNIIQSGTITDQNVIIFDITLTNWFTWLSIVAIVITAIWAIYQFDKNLSRKQQEKGAEIARLFSQDLLFKCTILGNVILDSGIDDIFKIDTLDYRVFKNFDRSEMYDIYSDDDIFLKLKNILYSDNTEQIYLQYLERNITIAPPKDIDTKLYTDDEAYDLFKLDNANMPFKFTQLVASVLNDLEYISMYIASQAAGSKYVYQSLHQIFLRTVKLLAPIIAMQNKDYSDKYYINIIHVYNEWATLRNLDLKREAKNKHKAKKILNPKIKTV